MENSVETHNFLGVQQRNCIWTTWRRQALKNISRPPLKAASE